MVIKFDKKIKLKKNQGNRILRLPISIFSNVYMGKTTTTLERPRKRQDSDELTQIQIKNH